MLLKTGWYDKSTGKAGPPGLGFKLTNSGNFDMINKRLENVGLPIEPSDAATKKYISNIFESNLNLNGKKVINVGQPDEPGDAVTLDFLKKNVMYKADSKSFDAQNMIISNVNEPEQNHDAVPLAHLKAYALYSRDESNFDANNKGITKLKAPTHDSDAVTLKYFRNYTLYNNPGTGYISANGKRITGLAEPQEKNSAATKKYVDDNLGSYITKDYANEHLLTNQAFERQQLANNEYFVSNENLEKHLSEKYVTIELFEKTLKFYLDLPEDVDIVESLKLKKPFT